MHRVSLALQTVVSRITDKNVKSSRNLIDKKGTEASPLFAVKSAPRRSYEIPPPHTVEAEEEKKTVAEAERMCRATSGLVPKHSGVSS